jgi:hypothetical protein
VKAYIYLRDRQDESLLAVVEGLEVVPRGLYVLDNVVYQYTGQPKFNMKKVHPATVYSGSSDATHVLESVELIVEKLVVKKVNDDDDSDLL